MNLWEQKYKVALDMYIIYTIIFLESELDGEFWLVKDPSQCKSTTWSVKVVVTFEQKLQPKIFAPTSSFRFNFEFNFGTILA